jgi:hypothetical protein
MFSTEIKAAPRLSDAVHRRYQQLFDDERADDDDERQARGPDLQIELRVDQLPADETAGTVSASAATPAFQARPSALRKAARAPGSTAGT